MERGAVIACARTRARARDREGGQHKDARFALRLDVITLLCQPPAWRQDTQPRTHATHHKKSKATRQRKKHSARSHTHVPVVLASGAAGVEPAHTSDELA